MGLDFLKVEIVSTKKDGRVAEPTFVVDSHNDLMVKGGKFYAAYDDASGLWITNRDKVVSLIDSYIVQYADDQMNKELEAIKAKGKDPACLDKIGVKLLKYSHNGMMDRFLKYCDSHCYDNFVPLNQKIVFADTVTTREDYATFKLPYSCSKGSTKSWDELMDVLYSEESGKIEWAIGSIVANESKDVQKFYAMYGPPGSGKSTVLHIIEGMFKGYVATFSAKALGTSSEQFALEPFKDFPLIAIEHDSDLSRIESNARLNSLISHEPLPVNEKRKSIYTATFNTSLFMGTNEPIKITNSKSGLIRRLIDISPTGNQIPNHKYRELVRSVVFEYGAIANKCLTFYTENKHLYDGYIPTGMMDETNDVYGFFEEYGYNYIGSEYVLLKRLWSDYKEYVDYARVPYPLPFKKFKVEVKEYFGRFEQRYHVKNGDKDDYLRSVFFDFQADKFNTNVLNVTKKVEQTENQKSWIVLKECEYQDQNKLNSLFGECPAQYEVEDPVNSAKRPERKWENCKTKLRDLDTTKVHYVKVPENLITLDFDIKGDDGEKSLEKNIEKASKYPKTYAEVSKSGGGLHLHYIYNGDVSKLSNIVDDNVECKVFKADSGSALRRRLTLCNDLNIAEISGGLPLKEDNKKVIDTFVLKNEKALRTVIGKHLRKEIAGSTSVSVNLIAETLKDAYNSGMKYDVTDMRPAVMAFAVQSTNQSERCLKVVAGMQFKSKDDDEKIEKGEYVSSVSDEDIRYGEYKDLIQGEAWQSARVGGSDNGGASGLNISDFSDFIFYDVEVFPNLFVVVWKKYGEKNKCVTWINPEPSKIESLCRMGKLVGFNVRQYDNHILYGRMLGYSEAELYRLSQRLVNSDKSDKSATFREAYNLSYTDIYDYCSAANKMSLKKWEIKLGIHHLELGLPWDKPVSEDLWNKVAEYCCNDVVSTEATFKATLSDYTARVILADIAGGSVNDTTNQLTSKLIFGDVKKPQVEFKYRNLAEPVKYLDPEVEEFLKAAKPDMMKETFGEEKSLLPYFKGYKYENGKSTYKDIEVGEGGWVCAEWGVWRNVALIDVNSEHPNSLISECLFGSRFTKVYKELVDARAHIKHKDWEKLKDVLDGRVAKYVEMITSGKIKGKDLSNALKTAINSVYGLTASKYPTKFKDDRNIDNIVAKRGALFMIDLAEAVRLKGFVVAHVKTDSIKIPNATPEIVKFVMDFGKKYGYNFEFEALYSQMCLINNAVYIAKYATPEQCEKLHGFVPGDNADHGGQWTATGAQFAEPYVFKNLFTHEEITMEDLSVTKSVKTYMVIDDNEGLKEDEHNYRFIGKVSAFCPVVDGVGGGPLYRVTEKKSKDNPDMIEFKYDSVTGTKGYKWLEYEYVLDKGIDAVDKNYFKELAQASIDDIEKYEPFGVFVGES